MPKTIEELREIVKWLVAHVAGVCATKDGIANVESQGEHIQKALTELEALRKKDEAAREVVRTAGNWRIEIKKVLKGRGTGNLSVQLAKMADDALAHYKEVTK